MKEYQVSDLFYTSWSHLTQKQIITMIELSDALRMLQPGTTEHGLVLINILRTLRKNKHLVSKLEVEQAVDIFNDIQFFLRNADGSFKTPWLFFPVESFTINGFEFRSPTHSDLPLFYHTFQQLVYADSAFSAFCLLNYQLTNKEGDERTLLADIDSALNSLIAVLFTLPEDFDIADMEVRARLVPLKLNIAKRSLVLHTYANVRQFIVNRCPHLFPSPPAGGEGAGGEVPTFTGPMWMSLRYDLAKTEVFKGFKTASDARIYDALDFLEKELIDAKQKPNGTAAPASYKPM